MWPLKKFLFLNKIGIIFVNKDTKKITIELDYKQESILKRKSIRWYHFKEYFMNNDDFQKVIGIINSNQGQKF